MFIHTVHDAETAGRLEHLPGYKAETVHEGSRDQLAEEIQTSEKNIFAHGVQSISDSIESLQQTGASLAKALKIWPKICESVATLST